MEYVLFGLLTSMVVLVAVLVIALGVSFITWSWCFSWPSVMMLIRLCVVLAPVFSVLAYFMVRD